MTRIITFAVLALSASTGCEAYVTTLVRDVRSTPDGILLVERCDLYQSNGRVSSQSVRDCRLEPINNHVAAVQAAR